MTFSFTPARACPGWYAASAIACLLLVAGCAEASPGIDNANPTRVAQVRQVCQSTMGYQPIDVEYRACVDSLMDSLAEVDHADAIERGRQLCAARGLRPGTPDFALCVVDHDQ